MNEELIKRIDECLSKPSELYSEHEKALYVLSDCRAALTKKYVPMTDDELNEISKKWQSDSVECMKNGQSIPPFHLYIEAEVIRRAGLEVQE